MDAETEKPRPPLFARILLFLFFASCSYGAYYLLASNPLGVTIHIERHGTATPTPAPH